MLLPFAWTMPGKWSQDHSSAEFMVRRSRELAPGLGLQAESLLLCLQRAKHVDAPGSSCNPG